MYNYWLHNRGFRLHRHSIIPQSTEIVVVGGGIAGLLTALSLADHNHSVILVDKNLPGHGATASAHGYLYFPLLPKLYGYRDLLELCQHSFRSLSDLFNTHGCGADFSGGIHLCTSEEEIDEMQKLELDKDFHCSILTRKQLEELNSFVGNSKGAIYFPMELTFDPFHFVQLVTYGLIEKKQHVLYDFKVTNVHHANNRLVVTSDSGNEIKTDYVIYCTNDIPSWINSNKLEQKCLNTVVCKTTDTVYPMFIPSKQQLIHKTADSILFTKTGPKHPERKDFKAMTSVLNNHFRKANYKPDYAHSSVVYETTSGLPLCGPIPNRPGEFLNVGYGYCGLGVVPVGTAVLVSYLAGNPTSESVKCMFPKLEN